MRNISCKYLAVTAVLATAGFTSLAMGQAANDECSTATVLTAGVAAPCDNTTATASADAAPTDTLCTGTFLDWGTANPDVWYSYTATANGTVDISTCLSTGFDTSIVLYSGSCGALTQVACNGDAPADAACQAFFSKITGYGVTAGSTYYLRVGGWNGTERGVTQVLLTFTPAAVGCPATGGCGVVHATPGCSDATCCTSVCAANPLCCEIGWDQSCVDAAVAACGIFVYNCVSPNPSVSNDCATNATIVNVDSTIAFNNTGCNQDGPNHSATTCSSGNDTFFNDIWYRAKALANGSLRVATCNQVTFDSKLAVYDMGTANPASFDYNTLNTALVACNDDGSAACQATAVYASELTINALQNHYYLIRVATYDVPGSGSVTIDLPEPCVLGAFTGTEAEACGGTSNNGCNAGGATEPLAAGATIKGTFWADAGARDTDFYAITVAQDANVSISIKSASFVTSFILGGDITAANCAGIDVLAVGSGNCPNTVSACLPSGTYYLFVAPSDFTGIPCGTGIPNEYTVTLNSTPATTPCPSFGDTCGYTVVNTVTQNNSVAITNYAFPCLLWCGSNGTTFNVAGDLARSFTGLNSGTIGCISVGYANADTDTTGAYGAAATPLTGVRMAIYRDTDGGGPTAEGVDLVELAHKDFALPGGFGILTWNLATPISLAGNTNDIVVMLSVPEYPGQCTAAVNGVAGGVGNNTGATSPWYLRNRDTFNICAPNNAFTAQTGTSQWIVELGMVSTAPPCPTDLNGDGVTGSADLSIVLNGWGTSSPDLNGDGVVGSADLSVVLNGWGACP